MSQDHYWDEGYKGWLFYKAQTYVRSGQIAGYDLDDFIQEGLFCYYKCYKKYIGKKTGYQFLPTTNPDKNARRHFMSIVCRTYSNHLLDLLNRYPAERECLIMSLATQEDQTEEDVLNRIAPVEEEAMTYASLVLNAPTELKQFFDLLVSDAVEGYRALAAPGRIKLRDRRTMQRETNSQYYARRLGLPSDFDMEAALRQYFGLK